MSFKFSCHLTVVPIRTNVHVFCFSSIDDIVLNYMISILEDLGSPDATEESFDVDSFSEMMDAYLPGFCNIQW
jgi:hypothetical protein